MWGTSRWARQASASAWWLCLQALAAKHIWTRKTNFSRQLSSCTHNWPVFQNTCVPSSSSPTTRCLLKLHWFRSNTQQAQHYLTHAAIPDGVKEGANALIPPQVYFLSWQSLEVIFLLLFFMPNSPLDSVFSCDCTCLALKPHKWLSFKAFCGTALCSLSADWGRGTISFGLDQTVLGHVSAKLRSSNLLKHPLYGTHFLSLITLFSLIFAFPVAMYLKAHLSLCQPTVISVLRTKSHDVFLFKFLSQSPSYKLIWSLLNTKFPFSQNYGKLFLLSGNN